MFQDTSTTVWEFTLQSLKDITDNFCEDHMIGSGAYGSVYKGRLLDSGEEIAMKKLHCNLRLKGNEFENEFNNLIMVRHQNIVRLVGYCYHEVHQRFFQNGKHIFALVEEKILCFEYLEGGSLDKHISDESSGLDWPTRYKIITGICDGVNYLHNGIKGPMYHLDLKPENILLDKTMIPKIADFGLSRLFGSTQTCITNSSLGTRGYMPPEYINRNEITPKFDVFSLGVIIIRIIAGNDGYPKCADMPSQEFIDLVHGNWEKRLHPTMPSHTSQEIKTCIEIALRCVEIERVKRPMIAEIIDELKKIGASFATVQSPQELGNFPVFKKVPYTTKRSPKNKVTDFRPKQALNKQYTSSDDSDVQFGTVQFNDDEPIIAPLNPGTRPTPIESGRVQPVIKNNNEVPSHENNQKVMLELTGGDSIGDRPGLDLVAVLDVSTARLIQKPPAPVVDAVVALADEVSSLTVGAVDADRAVAAPGNQKHTPNGVAEQEPRSGRARSEAKPRTTDVPSGVLGEHAAAGWPRWLTEVATEAVRGWQPRKAESFEKLDKIGEGTYSSVYRARDLENGKIVALKKVRFANMDRESVRFMAREIHILRRLDHPNVIKLEGLVTSRMSSSLYLVFEYMEHDLAGLAATPGIKFTEAQVKCYMKQLLSGLEHCHNRGVLHRDIKGANLLLDNNGVLKIADFGTATFCNPAMTSRVVTLWYRPPELLLGATNYGATVDLWSAGCILAELLSGKPIMPGRTEVEQLHKIFKLCGSPCKEFWANLKLSRATIFKPQHPYRRCVNDVYKDFPPSALALLDHLLAVEPDNRGNAASALESEFFTTKPYACDPSSLPKYPPSKEYDAKLRDEEARRQRAAAVKGHESETGRRKQLAAPNGKQENSTRSGPFPLPLPLPLPPPPPLTRQC